MNIKDFKIGQEVLIVSQPKSYEKSYTMKNHIVVAVGKKYVKTTDLQEFECKIEVKQMFTRDFFCHDESDLFLTEKVDYGYGNRLFVSENAFADWQEKEEHNEWFDKQFQYKKNRFTLEQLRAARQCLELPDIGEVSDGYHTFNSLYHQRLILFAALVNAYPDRAWKSKLHHDGEVPFGGGWFIVGITTPQGDYTYHYELKDWDKFNCPELERAHTWDGHTDKDVERLLSLQEVEK